MQNPWANSTALATCAVLLGLGVAALLTRGERAADAIDALAEGRLAAPFSTAGRAGTERAEAEGAGRLCPQCGRYVGPFSSVCPRCGLIPGTRGMARVALRGAPRASTLPSPRQQGAAKKELVEGHWLGLEVIPLTPELAAQYRIPEGERGVLVDEITLEAAESGILAGDMVHAINGCPTPNLKHFLLATQRVKSLNSAQVEVGRRGRRMTFAMQARNTPELGFAQMEAAQPIRPGAISPHRSRGRACTVCHIIMRSGGQLPTDAGDILPKPPPIARGAKAPHAYRGACNLCHRIIP